MMFSKRLSPWSISFAKNSATTAAKRTGTTKISLMVELLELWEFDFVFMSQVKNIAQQVLKTNSSYMASSYALKAPLDGENSLIYPKMQNYIDMFDFH